MAEFYKTKKKNILLDFFKENSNNIYTAKDLLEILSDIPKATIYRNLESLSLSKSIRKTYNSVLNAYEYQYSIDCCHHLHLKCSKCGKIIHLDCDKASSLISHINNSHGFTINLNDSILYGMCKECINNA